MQKPARNFKTKLLPNKECSHAGNEGGPKYNTKIEFSNWELGNNIFIYLRQKIYSILLPKIKRTAAEYSNVGTGPAVPVSIDRLQR